MSTTPKIILAVLTAFLYAFNSAAAANTLAVETSSTHETLSGDRGSWRQVEVLGLWQTQAKSTFTVAGRRTQRFGLNDTQAEVSASMLAAPGWRVEGEASNSSTHQVLPHWAARGRVWALDVQGMNLAVGAGRSLYQRGTVQGNSVLELQAERYQGSFRLAWRGTVTQLDGGGRAPAHMVSAHWYINDHASLGVVASRGREAESQPGRGVTLTAVQGLAMTARWRFAPQWSVNADVGKSKVGDAYTRTGFRVGLRHHF